MSNQRSASQVEDRPLRVAFETLGCRSNFADTTDLQAAILERGAVPCAFDAPADVYVINSCTVTDGADKEVFKLIRRARAASLEARIIVTGCLAEVGAERIAATASVDQVIGPGQRKQLLEGIFAPRSVTRDPQKTTTPPGNNLVALGKRRSSAESLNQPLPRLIPGPGQACGEIESRARFHLKVQEGCENHCSFCIIPQTRGAFSSRNRRTVLADIRRLKQLGYAEVVLTGTHLGGYGIDCQSSLLTLLTAIAESDPGVRIRLSSIDPNDLSPQIINLLSKSDVFCKHLHICVQAFCDRLLKLMNRKYRLRDVVLLLEQISESMPRAGLGSDLIAGFPGESRAEVDQAVETFLELPFSYLHVFPYSEREATAALRLPGAVDKAERKRRVARWRSVSDACRRRFLQGFVGRSVDVAIEEIGEHWIWGTSSEFITVKLPWESSQLDALNRERISRGRIVTVVGTRVESVEGALICE